jgi:hypothetical protein
MICVYVTCRALPFTLYVCVRALPPAWFTIPGSLATSNEMTTDRFTFSVCLLGLNGLYFAADDNPLVLLVNLPGCKKTCQQPGSTLLVLPVPPVQNSSHTALHAWLAGVKTVRQPQPFGAVTVTG